MTMFDSYLSSTESGDVGKIKCNQVYSQAILREFSIAAVLKSITFRSRFYL